MNKRQKKKFVKKGFMKKYNINTDIPIRSGPMVIFPVIRNGKLKSYTITYIFTNCAHLRLSRKMVKMIINVSRKAYRIGLSFCDLTPRQPLTPEIPWNCDIISRGEIDSHLRKDEYIPSSYSKYIESRKINCEKE